METSLIGSAHAQAYDSNTENTKDTVDDTCHLHCVLSMLGQEGSSPNTLVVIEYTLYCLSVHQIHLWFERDYLLTDAVGVVPLPVFISASLVYS